MIDFDPTFLKPVSEVESKSFKFENSIVEDIWVVAKYLI
jgi:hypothetical protein